MFYSPSKNAFYVSEIHGPRTLDLPDPDWQRPIIDGVLDQAAVHPLISVNNPACLIPADAVEITPELHAQLLADQSAGKQIKADAQGKPVAVEPPAPSLLDIKAAALSKVRAQRAPILSMLDGMQSSALTKDDRIKAQAIDTAKQGLKDLTKLDFGASATPDDFKTKVMTRYREIAAGLPVDVRIAFAEALV